MTREEVLKFFVVRDKLGEAIIKYLHENVYRLAEAIFVVSMENEGNNIISAEIAINNPDECLFKTHKMIIDEVIK